MSKHENPEKFYEEVGKAIEESGLKGVEWEVPPLDLEVKKHIVRMTEENRRAVQLMQTKALAPRFNEKGCPHCGYQYYDPLFGGTKNCLCRQCKEAY